MKTKVLPYNRTPEEENENLLFYVERILDLVDARCFLLAKRTFDRNKSKFRAILKPDHFNRLEEKTAKQEKWTHQLEQEFLERLEYAWTFGEHKSVHDFSLEILLHHDHRADSCPTHEICYKVQDRLAINNMHYLEPDEITLNTFIDAKIQFLVENRRPRSQSNAPLKGNPGFYLTDVIGRKYRCFVKDVEDVSVGDELKLKITNIPGPALTNGSQREPIVYLEPRISVGETIEIQLMSLSHTGNSFTFRHYSYDGFLWFKRRGVNKEIFNQNTLKPSDKIVAKVLYTTEEGKRTASGKITRLGIVKAIPVKRVEQKPLERENQDSGAAKALN